MSRRGVSYHVRATNRTWTSFVLAGKAPTSEKLAKAHGAAVVVIWADDDVGTTLQFATPDGWSAELPIPRGGDPTPISAADRKLLDRTTGSQTRSSRR